VIEFFKTFADYAKHERIKLTYITDATILIVMREIHGWAIFPIVWISNAFCPLNVDAGTGNLKSIGREILA